MDKKELCCDCSVIHREVVSAVSAEMLQNEEFEKLTAFFKALGDNTRLRILWALDRHELCVCDLSNLLGMTKSAVSHQLGYLRNVDLVRCRREGKTVYYTLADEHVLYMLEGGLTHIREKGEEE
ncbi:MAG: winged helix-turn-helix transcriptional regulator [Clostridia bacterium]|nr:winged helix-turn-helix transcriptional regulator [Clostridia bacterium]